MTQVHEERSLRDLFKELTREVSTLFRQEVALARSEISEDVSQVGSGISSLAVGGVIAFAGLLILLEAAVIGLAKVVQPWLAALIVGGVVVLIGVLLLLKGRSNLKMKNLMPRRTMESIQQDKKFAKEHM